jgi:branched-chain amino acid transport system substrate-binding protein
MSTEPIKIGYNMSLSGPLGANGQTALLAQRIWAEDVSLPVPTMTVPGVGEFIERYQARAASQGAGALGYYVAPTAYAQMQVIQQAISAMQSLDDAALVSYTRDAVFKTVMGDVKFAAGGEWSTSRLPAVQFRDIRSNEVAEFRGMGSRVVVSPDAFASGELVYPYANAKGTT